jgi:hypothetical protein
MLGWKNNDFEIVGLDRDITPFTLFCKTKEMLLNSTLGLALIRESKPIVMS